MLCHLKLMSSQTVNSQWGNSRLANKLVVYCSPLSSGLHDHVAIMPISSQLRFTPNRLKETEIVARTNLLLGTLSQLHLRGVPRDTDVCFCRLANQMHHLPVLSIINLQLSLRRNVCLQSDSLIDLFNLFYDLSLSTRCKAKIVMSYQCQLRRCCYCV